jgi:hypothetical protein
MGLNFPFLYREGVASVGSPNEYLRFAAECWAIAETVDDPASKANLLAMAAAWQRLAEFASGQEPVKPEDAQATCRLPARPRYLARLPRGSRHRALLASEHLVVLP